MPPFAAEPLQFAVLLTIAAGLGCGCRTVPESPQSFKRSYSEEAPLNRAVEKDIIALAERMGVTDIESVETSFAEPGHAPFIQVKEKETVKDRSVTYRTIQMYWRKWDLDFEQLAKETTAEGQVLAEPPETVEESILKVGDKEYRVNLDDNVPIATAEKILGCFLAGKIRFQKSEDETHPHRITDFNHPSGIRYDRTKGLYRITFSSPEGYRSSFYGVSLSGDEVVIHGVATIMA
ncbi:MAG TPA: hypothetical protein PLA50_09435 [Bacteroidia bacterium]|nr:hypothetical protein [Bacteroidia bacterium]